MKNVPKSFRVPAGKKVWLKDWPTRTAPLYESEKDYKKLLASNVSDLSDLQRVLFASDKYSVLLIFQAMDTAGKDGAIKHLLTGINPQGCVVHSFKHPSPEELDHDFLWRAARHLPERGQIGVFNRSYYEEVLIVRVHPEILRAQAIPDGLVNERTIWKERFKSIIDLEGHLHRNGTRVIKFFLHLSKEEQRKRLLERIDNPQKNWKFALADPVERTFWDQYMKAYEECLTATSTKTAPWHIVPADDKYNARLIISRIVTDALRSLKLDYPKLTPGERDKLKEIRKQLAK